MQRFSPEGTAVISQGREPLESGFQYQQSPNGATVAWNFELLPSLWDFTVAPTGLKNPIVILSRGSRPWLPTVGLRGRSLSKTQAIS
jgi:hypothetical protein